MIVDAHTKHIHARTHGRSLTYTHTYKHTQALFHSFTHLLARKKTKRQHARAREHTHTHTCSLTYTHTPARARAHTHTHTHAHAHAHGVCQRKEEEEEKGLFLRESADFMLCRGRPLKPVIAATAQQLENLLELRYENPNVDHAGVRRLAGLPGRVCSLTCRNCWRDADAPHLMCARTMPSAGSDAYGSEMRIMSLFVAP